MNIYEVIFLGSRGKGDSEDTIYLVRAPDFLTAVEDVQRNGSPSQHGTRSPFADIVYEVGVDLSSHADTNPRILRGPYFAFAYNFGWKSWERKSEDANHTNEWEEKKQAKEPKQ